MKVTKVILVISIAIELSAQELSENEKCLLNKIEALQHQFERNITELNEEINYLRANKNLNACENGWFAYLDQKCIQVLENKGAVDEGLNNCLELDEQASLLSIHSEHEMSFLSQLLYEYNDISDNAWIGLKFNGKGFEWFDKTELNYQHWDEDAKRDGKLPCVQMSLTKASLGKWKDESCDSKNLIVCQKKQSTITVLLSDLWLMSKVLDDQQVIIIEQNSSIKNLQNQNNEMQKKINSQQARIDKLSLVTIPIGFLYTQLPTQSAPTKLWPKTKWTEVTHQYAGQFFRAEGGGSAPFGKTQGQSYNRITAFRGDVLLNPSYKSFVRKTFNLEEGAWSGVKHVGDVTSPNAMDWLQFYSTKVENRPRNTAIKIWKRTG